MNKQHEARGTSPMKAPTTRRDVRIGRKKNRRRTVIGTALASMLLGGVALGVVPAVLPNHASAQTAPLADAYNDPSAMRAQVNADQILTMGVTWERYFTWGIGHGSLGMYRLHAKQIGNGNPAPVAALNAQLDQAWVLPWGPYFDRATQLFMAYCGVYGADGCAQVIFEPVYGQQVVQ